ANGPLHRGEPAPRVELGGLRAERRTAVGADPRGGRQLHAAPVRRRGLSRGDAARGVPGQVRPRDDDGGRRRPGDRQHRRRLRSAEAGGVRGAEVSANRRSIRVLTRFGHLEGAFMTVLTAPGVYIEEIPSGTRSITGVATSITAF